MDSPSPLSRLFSKGRECRLTYRPVSKHKGDPRVFMIAELVDVSQELKPVTGLAAGRILGRIRGITRSVISCSCRSRSLFQTCGALRQENQCGTTSQPLMSLRHSRLQLTKRAIGVAVEVVPPGPQDRTPEANACTPSTVPFGPPPASFAMLPLPEQRPAPRAEGLEQPF